jgi:FlaA1/EpsC-like NDP-sugar epimerase
MNPQTPQTPQQKLAAPEPHTEWEALRKLNVITTADFVAVGSLVAVWTTMFFWWFFSQPQPLNLVLAAILTLIIFAIWLVVLVYRVHLAVIDIQAYLNNVPVEAARIVMAAQSGKPLP